MKLLLGYVLTFGWVFLMLGLTLVLKKATRAGDEVSRKIIHISVAFAWIPMYLCFGITWHLLVPPLAFVVLNYISCKKDLFKAMERSDESKKSFGTVYYAFSMAVMAGFTLRRAEFFVPYGVGLFCMAFGDGLAPIFGGMKKGNRPLFGGRTLYGSCAVFGICALVIGVMGAIFALSLTLGEILLTALAATALELVGLRGFDNITLPLGVFFLTFLFSR